MVKKSNDWIVFRKKHAGKGKTLKELSEMYKKRRKSPRKVSLKKSSSKSQAKGRCKSKVGRPLTSDEFYCLRCCSVMKSEKMNLTQHNNRGRTVYMVKGVCENGHSMSKIIKESDARKISREGSLESLLPDE